MIDYMKPSSSNCAAACNDHVLQPKGCCISTILWRILCFSSNRRLPWYRFNHHRQQQHQRQHLLEGIIQHDHQEEEEKTSRCSLRLAGTTAPGLVARLMGLDSLPRRKETTTEENQPLMMNSPHSKKPRIKSRIKVIPTCQELEEDGKFYILRFEGSEMDNEVDKYCRRKKKRSMSRKRREGDDKENDSVIINAGSKGINVRPLKNYNSSRCHEKAAEQVRTRNKKDRVKAGGDDASMVDPLKLENSSPNSVLEFVDEFRADDDDQTTACSPGNDISRLANSKTRRTLSEELKNCRKPNHKSLQRLGKNAEQNLRKKNRQQKIINYADGFLTGTKLATMDIANLTWIQEELMLKSNQECLKEIARDVTSEILDDLILDELLLLQ